MKPELSADDSRRYSRTIMLPEIGREGQLRLLNASAMVVGSGALGSIAAMYLAASGVGRIGIADFDTVDISNLQRQLSFGEADLGKSKAATLERRLHAINSGIVTERHEGLLTASKAEELFPQYDIILEGSDNPATKYMVADTARKTGRPCVLGGVSGFNGQVLTLLPDGPAYSTLFPPQEADPSMMPCSLGGVLGPVPGIVASAQAAETIKLITGAGSTLAGRILLIDALNMTFTTLRL